MIIINVLKAHWTTLEAILLQKIASEGQLNCCSFLIVHFGLQANAGRHGPPNYAIDYKFGFDFGFWANLI